MKHRRHIARQSVPGFPESQHVKRDDKYRRNYRHHKNTGIRFPLIFTSGRNTIESIVPAAAITDNTIAAVIISSSNEKALYSHFEKFATIIA